MNIKKISCTTVIILLFQIIPDYILAVDRYSVIPLPEGFYSNGYRALNNIGQVTGVFQSHAACWDPIEGLRMIPLDEITSAGCAINDRSYIAVSVYNSNQKRSTSALWDVNTNKLKYGPIGIPHDINIENKILIMSNPFQIWNSERDSTEFVCLNVHRNLNDSGIPLQVHVSDKITTLSMNKYGSILCYTSQSKQLMLLVGSEFKNVHIPGDFKFTSNVFLNDNNEILALTKFDQDNVIVKWGVEGCVSNSNSLNQYEEFYGCNYFVINGFNSNGDVLLYASTPDGKVGRTCILRLN